MDQIISGKYDRSQLQDAQKEFDGQVRLINAVIQAFAVQAKNKRASLALGKMNILDEDTAINLGLPDGDMIKCPEKEQLIKREYCLDYSGTHLEDCRSCNHFSANRTKLLGSQSGE
jgi:hypothetical protein